MKAIEEKNNKDNALGLNGKVSVKGAGRGGFVGHETVLS